MKNIIIIFLFLLNLQSFTKADEISDFEIEGMSIGDSLLDFYSKKEIKDFYNYDNLPSDMKFRIADDDFSSNLNQYEALQFFYKPQDRKFIIHNISGRIFCKNDNECNNILESIKSDISKSFVNKQLKKRNFKHVDDPSGKSIVVMYSINLNKGTINIGYTNWSENVKYSDHIGVSISTTEVINWTRNNYGAN
tara:strand:+ start:718 stop:1296 length:579 start_codon:yes stop_codon:yes gene_type:complete